MSVRDSLSDSSSPLMIVVPEEDASVVFGCGQPHRNSKNYSSPILRGLTSVISIGTSYSLDRQTVGLLGSDRP